MIFVTTYKVKPFIATAENKLLLEAFAQFGAGPGVKAHYIAADGSHGITISETDDVAGSYRNLLNYAQWMEFSTSVMLAIEDAVPLILETLG